MAGARSGKRAPVFPEQPSPALEYYMNVRPMEPLSSKVPPAGSAYIYQIKWDGVRILALIEDGRVILKNRKGSMRTEQYPELQRAAELVKARNAVLDGEVVALTEGKPSFARVIRRDFCRREEAIRALQRQIPCTYCLFDLLYLEGADLALRPIEERHRLLKEVVEAALPLYLNDNFQDGGALYRQVEEAGLEGIVAKKKGSPYRGGRKSADWLKIKPRQRRLCVIGGLTMSRGSVGALLLGAYRDGELLYIGKAGSGLKDKDLLLLRDYARQDRAAEPGFSNPPRGKDLLWLKPRLTVQVEFAEWTADLRLRAPVVIGFTGRSPSEALL